MFGGVIADGMVGVSRNWHRRVTPAWRQGEGQEAPGAGGRVVETGEFAGKAAVDLGDLLDF